MTALSVVLAVQGGAQHLPTVLDELGAQIAALGDPAGVEVLVVYAAEEVRVPELCAPYPWARAHRGSDGALIPHLWRDGIDWAVGERVALSTAHCRPGPDWVHGLLAADLERFAGVGGALRAAPDSDAVGWAIHLLRYLHYTPPFSARPTHDVAGDNVVYGRDELQRYAAAFRDGFWEPEIHTLMAKAGRQLLLDPSLLSLHDNGYSVREFAVQRFRHGTRFGYDRGRHMSRLRRFAQVGLAPAIPLVFGAKIVRETWQKPELRAHLPKLLPYLTVFLHAWALGELRGTLEAVREDP